MDYVRIQSTQPAGLGLGLAWQLRLITVPLNLPTGTELGKNCCSTKSVKICSSQYYSYPLGKSPVWSGVKTVRLY